MSHVCGQRSLLSRCPRPRLFNTTWQKRESSGTAESPHQCSWLGYKRHFAGLCLRWHSSFYQRLSTSSWLLRAQESGTGFQSASMQRKLASIQERREQEHERRRQERKTLKTRGSGAAAEGAVKAKPRPKKKRRHAEPDNRQEGAVSLSHADFSFSKPGPWNFQHVATAEDLRLHSMIPSLSEEAAAETLVSVKLKVDQVGAGYFVWGRCSACIPQPCRVCQAPISTVAEGSFKVWLDGAADLEDDLYGDVAEVAFSRRVQRVSLDEHVNHALVSALPPAVCSDPWCSRGG